MFVDRENELDLLRDLPGAGPTLGLVYRSPLETGLVDEVWTTLMHPRFDQFMGHCFERIAQQALARHYAAFSLPPIANVGRWEGSDRSKRPVEIDLVARTLTGDLVIGEVKWSSRPIGRRVHADLERKVRDLAHSGVACAHDAASESTRFVYFSAAGFDEEFREQAVGDTRVRLIGLEELYGSS